MGMVEVANRMCTHTPLLIGATQHALAGLANFTDDDGSGGGAKALFTRCGSPYYVAPEVTQLRIVSIIS